MGAPMETTPIILMAGLVMGYLLIERMLVTPPKFLSLYLLFSAILIVMTL